MTSAMMMAQDEPVKLTDAQRRNAAYQKTCDVLRPYLGQVIAEWHDQRKNAMYLFLVCSKEEDAGDGRHRWRGAVTVNIQHDGSVFFAFSEDLVIQALAMEERGTWEATEKVLNRLLPPLNK